MYVDSALRATGGYSGTLAPAGSGGSLVIGSAADGAASFQGSLDEVAYYNKVLDASRIRAQYTAGRSQPGGLYLTGHDPDDHAVGDAANRSINNTAVRYVTSSMPRTI